MNRLLLRARLRMRLTRDNHDGECQEVLDVVLGSNLAANAVLDELESLRQRTAAAGGPIWDSFLEFIRNIDWETLIKVIIQVVPAFLGESE